MSIYNYLDYHQFLRDRYDEIRQRNPLFSYRSLAPLVGLRSAGQVSSILQGKRNISSRCFTKFARAFCLKKGETPYFQLLVSYAGAKSHMEKRMLFERIVECQKRNHVIIDESKYVFFSRWYHAALRELVEVYEITDSTPDIGQLLVPAIPTADAKASLHLLESLALIRKDSQGRYRRTDITIVAPDDWKSLAIKSFQVDTAELGKEALERIPKEDRSMSTLTLSISRDSFEVLRRKLVDLWNESMVIASQDTRPQQVFQMNLQLFPLSKRQGD